MPGPGPSIERATEIIPLPIPTLPWPTPKAELCSYPQCLTGIPLLLAFLTLLGLPGAFDWLRPCPVQFSPTGISGALCFYFSRVGSQCSANLSTYSLLIPSLSSYLLHSRHFNLNVILASRVPSPYLSHTPRIGKSYDLTSSQSRLPLPILYLCVLSTSYLTDVMAPAVSPVSECPPLPICR